MCVLDGGRRAAHKTKQGMTKHLALLASLGKLGLSEHIVVVESVVDLRGARQGRRTESRVCVGAVSC